MGFTMPSDPLNVFNNELDIKCEDEEEEEQDDGLHSFTGHSLSVKSKLDAFDSKIQDFDDLEFAFDSASSKKEKKNGKPLGS